MAKRADVSDELQKFAAAAAEAARLRLLMMVEHGSSFETNPEAVRNGQNDAAYFSRLDRELRGIFRADQLFA